VETGDIAGGNFGDSLAEQIRGFGPATAEGEGNIVAVNARELLDDDGGVARQGERAIRCLRGLGRHEIRLPRIPLAGTRGG
jgi:hypothetical protein